MNGLDIYTLCCCEQLDFVQLKLQHPDRGRFSSYRNAVHWPQERGDVYLFDYGALVFWDVDPERRTRVIDGLAPYMFNPLSDNVDDEFTYEVTDGQRRINDDHIRVSEHDVMTQLALSHAMAQSTKLGSFEQRIQDTINDTAHIPKNIANTGSSRLGRKALAKLRGRLFLAKSDIMLKYDLLDVPDFFWEYPELDGYYNMLADYLEVRQRVEVLSKKLETIHELFEMMADEQKHKHSSLLEWIIIWLIAFEIVVFLVHDIFDWI
ncbi:MAG: RMD1 family protein [Gammaproteobacteria bacterium]|nr:RMD1 family protein [Gammaproteobacteria bacterium]MDH5800454.1 RMD1 family protein [Gammaproteobacteria bacterium]